MGWDFKLGEAIYQQIADKIRSEILRGVWAPGSQIPAVRSLAWEASVNPNTIQHALLLLEEEGLLEARGTMGRFVTEDEKALHEARRAVAGRLTAEYGKKLRELGLSAEEIRSLLQEAVREGDKV